MNSKQPHFAMHPSLPEHKYTTLHSSSEAIRRACLQTPQVNYFPPKKTSTLSFERVCVYVCICVYVCVCARAACRSERCLCVITRGAPRHIQPRRALNVFFMYSTAITRRVFFSESLLTQRLPFVLIFMTLPLLKEYSGCVMRRQKSRLTDTFICVLFLTLSLLFFFPPCLSPFLTHFAPLTSTLLSPPSFFFFSFFFLISALAAAEQHICQPG